jgi:hypothetical protein
MTALKRKVVEATMDQVEVVYLSRETSKWWNARRRPDDTATFCGWYWLHKREEMGPFRSRSACIRAAYYRFVLEREVPSVTYGIQESLHGSHKVQKISRSKKSNARHTSRRKKGVFYAT